MKKKPSTPIRLPTHHLREIAAEAKADPRTVANLLAGGPREGMARQRILAVLARMGIMAALIASIAIAGCRNSNGTPVSGGRVFLTRPGSTASVTAYTDRDATASHVLNAGGVLLDAGGRAKIYTTEPADVRVEDSTGVTVDTFNDPGDTADLMEVRNPGFMGVDPVTNAIVAGGRTRLGTVLTNLATSVGGTDGYFRVTATGALRTIQSKFSEVQVSVKDFKNANGDPAQGNGVADDTAAIQAAIDYVRALGGGVVYFPPGTYLITAALLVQGATDFVGAGATASSIKASSTTQNAFTATAATQFSKLKITHSSTSSGAAISSTAAVGLLLASIGDSKFANGVVVTGVTLTAIGSTVQANSAVAGYGVSGGGLYSSGSFISGNFGAEITAGGLGLISGSGIVGLASSGLSITATGANVSMAGGYCNGSVSGIVVASTYAGSLSWSSTTVSPSISDARTAAPVAYAFAADGNFTPLPLQAEAIRVVATAAAVVTINAIAATGFGRKFSLICARTTASAVTFTFAAQYVLSAAVAPANGNRVNLLLEYNPIDGKTYEIGRAATAN